MRRASWCCLLGSGCAWRRVWCGAAGAAAIPFIPLGLLGWMDGWMDGMGLARWDGIARGASLSFFRGSRLRCTTTSFSHGLFLFGALRRLGF